LKPGDNVLVPDDAFQGTIRILRDLMPKWGISYTVVNMTDLVAVAAAVESNTALIWTETLSNPLLKVTDIGAIARLAHEAKAICVVDNTFATPVLQQPLLQGADLVLHASTKYIGGHGDVLGGIIVGNGSGEGLMMELREIQALEGAIPSPFDCWLIHRGLKTLSCRVQAHSKHAMQIATYLSEHELVRRSVLPRASLSSRTQTRESATRGWLWWNRVDEAEEREGCSVASGRKRKSLYERDRFWGDGKPYSAPGDVADPWNGYRDSRRSAALINRP
jgi:cystathionine beta-lyase/cystathionine gamma-synthase